MSAEENGIDPREWKWVLARAFDSAWHSFIANEGGKADTPENRGKLAARIVTLSKLGFKDERELGEAALIYLRASQAISRISRPSPVIEKSNKSSLDAQAGATFDPEAIKAICDALDMCLEELPLALPSAALQMLTRNLMDAASRGLRDPQDLKSKALEALRSRR